MSERSHFFQMSAEDYLELPRIKALLAAANAHLKGEGSKSKGNGSVAAVQPEQLGEPTSSFHTAELNELGQKLGIVPKYDFEGDNQQGWGGTLSLGERTITKDGMRWQTKKAAKDGLAELGLEAMKGTTSVLDMVNTRNWAGLLHEFYNNFLSSDVGGPVFTEYSIGSSFACTCTIPARSESFGCVFGSFPNKKAARASAAMEAMEFLIEQGLANSEGKNVQVKAAKKKSKEKVEAIERVLSNVSTTDAQKINELCPLLGIPLPIYRFGPSPDAPVGNILSGAAYFPDNNPLLSGPVGMVRNVFSKKRAKEECAREVYRVLMQIATTEKDLFE